jgi:putative transposase
MPRRARVAFGGMVYHVLNRGNGRMRIFSKPGDYSAFIKLLEEARIRTSMRILSWCLMPNHWHLVLWPHKDGDLASFVGWLSNTHVRRWRAHRHNTGEGHLYQGRYKSFIIQTDQHLLTVLRYVEQNPMRAGSVTQAQDWQWSSATREPLLIADAWPLPKPDDWASRLNTALPQVTLDRLQVSITRGRPFGSETWLARNVKRFGLEYTVRDPWRPTKEKKK